MLANLLRGIETLAGVTTLLELASILATFATTLPVLVFFDVV
jgi:hypothetical protein